MPNLTGRGAVWLARMTGGHEVGGSSPLAPIIQPLAGKQLAGVLYFPLLFLRAGLVLILVFFIISPSSIPMRLTCLFYLINIEYAVFQLKLFQLLLTNRIF